MIARIQPGALCGSVKPPSSKSALHRALICAFLSDTPTRIGFRGELCDDVRATRDALTVFGADIAVEDGHMRLSPRKPRTGSATADCHESGSTLRFLLPVAAALGIEACFLLRGRLAERPVAALADALRSGGCMVDRPCADVLRVRGRLRAGEYVLPGDVSSQYISGLLMALSVCSGQSRLRVTGEKVSAPYIAMTLDMLSYFGARIVAEGDLFYVNGHDRLCSPGAIDIEGDPSAAAFWYAASLIGENRVRVLTCGGAHRGDALAPELLKGIAGGTLNRIDLSDIPDLAAPLAACAAAVSRRLTLDRAGRLRDKESDRVCGIVDMVNTLGGRAEADEDCIEIFPAGRLPGGTVDPQKDHRLFMAAAVAATACAGEVMIRDAECVCKSYPGFADDFRRLGGRIRVEV